MQKLACLAALAAKSAWNRRFTLCLVMLSVSLSTMLLVGIERIRGQVRAGFTESISGTDLAVGARGSGIQLILYAVFHMGGATNNMSWASYEEIRARPEVAWAIPLSMGDSHRGYPVVATTEDFFKHYRARRGAELELASGRGFADIFETVLGSEVAERLHYQEGASIVLTHGGDARGAEHGDKPFTVVGVLKPTGSPVDRSLYINLESMEAIHVDWRGGAPIRGFSVSSEQVRKFDLRPKVITAMLVGLKNRRAVFALQREIQSSRTEALSAVLPGVALDQLWSMIGGWEKVLVLVSVLVTFTGLAGLCSTILAGLGERRRELAILRSTGASPWDVAALMAIEGFLITAAGVIIGLAALAALIAAAGPRLLNAYGVDIYLSPPGMAEWLIILGVTVLGVLTSLIPALRAYFLSLSDGLSPSV
jgi:putative ABC transport system permease protein